MRLLLLNIVLVFLGIGAPGSATMAQPAVGHPTFLSPHFSPVVVSGTTVFVVNTPADTVDVIDAASLTVTARIQVGIDPVSLAVRPDGSELWVSNHVSDSVSIIDTEPNSPTWLQVIDTIQDFDPVSGATRFDEPVGIAFANNSKAYVALSSENRIAVINVPTRRIVSRLVVPAQDPRALAVRNGRLYVLPFESGNRTQISGCSGPQDGVLCTFDAVEHVVDNNNVLSRFIVVDIVKHPQVPDRDLFVYDTASDLLIETVDSLGTLLYGLAVDSANRVFVAQTDARNDANGRAGTASDGLAEMGNRAFLNRLTSVDCDGGCTRPQFIDLEPLPPQHPDPQDALATPFAVAISADDATLVATAAGSNRLFTVDAASGAVLGRVATGSVPRGIALLSDAQGRPSVAWVLNAVDNTVERIDLTDRTSPRMTGTVALDDPTHPAVKRGRRAFNDAMASTTGTFSCESCHPDGGTDQLLWVLDTPICSVAGCTQIAPRITMPIRGLRDTAPFHWDGIPGDPYGGNNTANIFGRDSPNCDAEDPASCTRHLTDGSLGSTMCQVGGCPTNDEGKAGALSAAERDDLAKFLLSVPYPPAQRRAFTNRVSARARSGFSLFHIEGDLQGDPAPNVCGDCHRMPFWVSTNTPGTGMEAPTWRGAWDRWLILPQGRLNIIGFDFYNNIAQQGAPERLVWQLSWASRSRFNPVWDMVLEGSTGFHGAFGRQLTLNAGSALLPQTAELLDALELAASEDGIVLTADGARLDEDGVRPLQLAYSAGLYQGGGVSLSRESLVAGAASGTLLVTLTGRVGPHSDLDHPQPALWTLGPIEQQRGRQVFPELGGANRTMRLSGRHVRTGAHLLVNGRRVAGNVRCSSGTLPDCDEEILEIQLATLPSTAGMHLLQVQNRGGLLSNDFIFHTLGAGGGELELDVSGPWFNPGQDGHGWFVEQLAPLQPGLPERLNVYWYVYSQGQPLWLIGQGDLAEGRARLAVFVTTGGGFPPEFDPDLVSLSPWGTMHFEFADDDTASVSWEPVGAQSPGSLNIQRLAPIAPAPAGCLSGSYYNPAQNGHGFVAQVVSTPDGLQLLLSWYVYADGQQVWLLGQAPLENDGAQVALTAFSGAEFPPDFAAEAVTGTPWGIVDFRLTGPDTARAEWASELAGFGAGGLDLERLSRLSGCP